MSPIKSSTSSPSLKTIAAQSAAQVAKAVETVPMGKAVLDVFTSAVKAAALEPTVLGKNVSTSPLNSARGRISEAAWNDPTLLVGSMTQNTSSGESSAAARCGNTNLLAGALLAGPAAAAKMLQTTAHNSKLLSAGQKKDLQDIAARVKNHTATFEDLSTAQNLLYAASNTRSSFGTVNEQLQSSNPLEGDELATYEGLKEKIPNLTAAEQKQFSELLTTALDREVNVVIENDPKLGKQLYVQSFPGTISGDQSGLDDKELSAAARNGGLSTSTVPFDASKENSAATVLAALKPGEQVVLRLGIDGDATAADHFVTVGKLKDGRPFIYNPDPQAGDSTLTVGVMGKKQAASFDAEVAKYSGRAHLDLEKASPAATKVKY